MFLNTLNFTLNSIYMHEVWSATRIILVQDDSNIWDN